MSGSRRYGVSVIAILAAVGGLSAPAWAQDAEAGQNEAMRTAPQSAEAFQVDEVVVRGIRAALARGLDVKRNSDQITDVIDAEDVGKLPDTNVAEALQRITGVQINRDLGEGSEIAVRGFSQNRVEINGQTQVGSGATGGVSFNTIPSEAFSRLEVVKTPAADQIEGALGATIKLQTRQPLESRRPILTAAVQQQYADRADAYTTNYNLLGSRQWDGAWGRFGALFSVVSNERRVRQDFFENRGWDAVNGFGRDLDGDGLVGEVIQRDADGNILSLQDGAYVPTQTRLQIKEQNRKLQSYTTALQYQPRDGLELYFNGTYNRNQADDFQYQSSTQFNSALQPDPLNGGNMLRPLYQDPAGATITPDQTVLAAMIGQINPKTGQPMQGVNFNLSSDSNPLEQEVFTGQFGVKADLGERLRMDVQATLGRGEQSNDYFNTTSGIGGADRPFYYFDFGADADIPTMIPLRRTVNGVTVRAPSDEARIDMADVSSYSLASIVLMKQSEKNREATFRADFDYDLGRPGLPSIEFGLRISDVAGERSRLRGRDSAGPLDGPLGGLSFAQLEALYPGITTVQPYGDVLNGASGDFPRTWRALNPQVIRNNLGAIRNGANFTLAPDSNWGFDVSQKTQAAYLKANLDFMIGNVPVRGNAGLRWVRTDQDASGSIPSGTQASPSVTIQTVSEKYHNWLPSLSLVAEPMDRFFVRFGMAKAMARPRLIDVAPMIAISDSFDTAVGGNPYLQPEEVAQVDLSFEKYYGRANLLSLALFHKNFDQRIEGGIQERCLPISAGEPEFTPGSDGCLTGQDRIKVGTKVNAGSATVQGFEVGWQQNFDFLPGPLDGFGMIANYTYVDSDGGSVSTSGLALPVQDLSEHSYNLIVFYEKGPFEARAAYNWRSEFYDDRTTTNQASFAKAYGQLDASIGLDLGKRVSINLEAVNILNEPDIRYQEIEERLLSYRVNDTRYLLGLRVRY